MTQPIKTILNLFIKPPNAKENHTKTRTSHPDTISSEPILFELSLDKPKVTPYDTVQEDFQKQRPHHLTEVELQMLARKW
jgi:hypothetical protein